MSRERGFTLLELLVVALLMTVVVMAAAALVEQSLRLLARTGTSLRAPSLAPAAARLRQDLHAARAVDGEWGWSGFPLELRLGGERRLRIEREASRLVRLELDAEGRTVSRQVLLQHLLGWRWRSSSSWVQVEIQLEGGGDPWRASGRGVEATARVESLWLALRGAGGGRSW